MNVNGRAIGRIKGAQVIVAVPNDWLQLPIIDMLSAQREEFSRVKSLAELYQRVRECPQCIVIIDIFAFTEDQGNIVERLIQVNPCLSLIYLVSGDKVAYGQYLDRSDSCYIIPKEKIDMQLLPMLECAHKDQRLIDSTQKSLSTQKQLPALIKKEANQMEKESHYIFGRKFGRRSFLKGSAAVAAVAGVAVADPGNTVMKALAVGEKTEPAAGSEEKVFAGVCRGNCDNGCFLNVYVRDGKVVMTDARDLPNPEYNRICVKGLTHAHRIYHPNRIRYPMKRVGERGEGKWQQISWDEAISTITSKWNQYTNEVGPSGFAMFPGSGSYGLVTGAQTTGSPVTRLINLTGCALISMAVDIGGISAGPLIGSNTVFGSANSGTDYKNAKTILVWGANPVVSQIQSTHFLLEAQEQGTKLVVIDPLHNILAQRADMYVPIKSGMDAVLAMAMINVILENGWQDQEFLNKHTSCSFLVKESDGLFLRAKDLDPEIDEKSPENVCLVMDKSGNLVPYDSTDEPVLEGSFTVGNGIKVNTSLTLLLERTNEWTVEKAAVKCGIPAEQIIELADLYANNKPSMIYRAYGHNHYYNATGTHMAVNTLMVISGNIGGKGSGLAFGLSSAPYLNTKALLWPEGYTGKGSMMGTSPISGIPVTSMDQVVNEHKYGYESGYGEMPMNIKGLYATHVNFMTNGAERQYTLDWLKKIEFFVYTDMNMNETAQYADILLPAAHWFECEDIFYQYCLHPYLLHQEKCIEPCFEAKPDWEIIKLIAEGIGYGEFFQMTPEDYIRTALDSDKARALGMTYESVVEKKAISGHVGETSVYAEDKFFATAGGTGRAHIYLEHPEYTRLLYHGQKEKSDLDIERMAHFIDPLESGHDNPIRKKYPFQMLSSHSRFRTHSQWWDVDVLLEIDKEPTLKINTSDAEGLGIKNGDLVKVYNDRGYVIMKANIDGGTQPGVVTAPKGWEKHQFIDGHFSNLTTRTTHNYIVNSIFNDVAVAVEKYKRGTR